MRSRLVLVAVVALVASSTPARAQEVVQNPPGPRQEVFGRVLARELGLRLLEVKATGHRLEVDGRWLDGRGPRVRLEGLEVTRLEFANAGDALYWLANVARPDRAPLVGDARGKQLVLLSGPRLADAPARAARVLSAAWGDEVLPTPQHPLEALRVASPPVDEAVKAEVGFDSVLLLGRGDTPAYTFTLEKLRRARAYSKEPREGGPVVRFVTTNHFTFETAGASWSEVAMSQAGALSAVGRSSDRCRSLVKFARAILDASPAAAEAEAAAPRRRMLALCDAVAPRTPSTEPAPVETPLGE